jgi:hypothetical protein
MDLSKVKVEVYDFLAVIIPGLLLGCELWITVRGWSQFAQGILNIGASAFTMLLLVAFALGNLLQELADVLIKWFKGKRYFKASRDNLWDSKTGEHVNARITRELGHPVADVDVAFDYCLTRIQSTFSKRDLFLANSDFARGLVVVSFIGTAPLIRITNDLRTRWTIHASCFATGLILLFLIACLGWVRMKRFRELSETPVFHAFLAQPIEVKSSAGTAK